MRILPYLNYTVHIFENRVMMHFEYKREKVAYLKANFVGPEINESRKKEVDEYLVYPPYEST